MGLFEPLWKTTNPEKVTEAAAAVRAVTDPKKLREIALGASFAEIQCAAVGNLTDEKILEEIIRTETTAFQARKEAVSRIRDEKILAGIAVSRGCYPADGEAIAQITDAELLKQIAMSEQGWEQSKAVYKIRDQHVLAEIAARAEKGEARKTAVRCITSPEALLDLMESSAERFVKNEAFRRFDEILRSGTELTPALHGRYLNAVVNIVHRDDPVSLDYFQERTDLERIYRHALREDLRAEAFSRLIAGKLNSRDRLREIWKLASRNYVKAGSAKGGNPWETVLNNVTIRILNSHDPALLAACIGESESGPDLAAGFLKELFGERFRDEAGIEMVRDEGVAAYIGNLKAYAERNPAHDMQYCLLRLAEAVPPETAEHKWYRRFLKHVR